MYTPDSVVARRYYMFHRVVFLSHKYRQGLKFLGRLFPPNVQQGRNLMREHQKFSSAPQARPQLFVGVLCVW